jgi:transcriptional/translational regulatory protein YebC/TACO1
MLSIYTKPEDLEAVRKALVEQGHEPASSEVEKVPSTTVPLEEKEAIQTLKLLDRLEDLDDVQRVYSNADFPDEVLAAFTG